MADPTGHWIGPGPDPKDYDDSPQADARRAGILKGLNNPKSEFQKHPVTEAINQACQGAYPRQTAQDAIQRRITEYKTAIFQLEALSRALPLELISPADDLLRDMVLGY